MLGSCQIPRIGTRANSTSYFFPISKSGLSTRPRARAFLQANRPRSLITRRVELIPKDGDLRGRIEPKLDPTATNRQYSNADVVANDDRFTHLATQDQHLSRS